MILYVGIVENNDDPDKTGKVQIRIPELNGTENADIYDEEELLLWFEPCTPFFGGYQYGSFIVPPVGAIVWCAIEEVESGNPYQIYLGGCYGTGTLYGKKFGGKDVPKKKLETPEEAVEDYPNTSILFKSLNGSVVMVDGDGTIILKNEDDATVSLSDESITIDANDSSIEVRGDGKILITGDVELTGKLDVTDDVTVDSNVTIKGKADITGKVTSDSLSTNSGTFSDDATIGGKSFLSHIHAGVHGNTSPPL